MTNTLNELTDSQKITPDSIQVNGKTYKKNDFEVSRIPFEVSRHHKNDIIFTKLDQTEKKILNKFKISTNRTESFFNLINPDQTFILQIPSGKIIKEPIILKYKPAKKNICFSLFIYVEENTKAVILEDMSKMVESELVLFKQQTIIERNSNLKYIKIQNASVHTNIIENRTFQTKENSISNYINFNFGGKTVNEDIEQTGMEKNSVINTNIIGKCQKNQIFDFKCTHNHISKQNKGKMLIKGIAHKKAKIKSYGLIKIQKTGKNTTSYMHNDFLNLESDSCIESYPHMKIKTDEVKASHKSSIRNISKEELFYLNSRGLDTNSSRKILTRGFLKKELKQINDITGAYEWVKRLI